MARVLLYGVQLYFSGLGPSEAGSSCEHGTVRQPGETNAELLR